MASDWETIALREAGVILIDCVHKTPEAAPAGYPYIAIPQMVNGRLDFDTARKISAGDLAEWTKKARPQAHDIVLSRRCNPGETAYVADGEVFALGQNLVLLRADGKAVFPPFLRWVTRGPEWWEQIGKNLNVGAVFDSLKCADVPKFELTIPPLEEQRAIAEVLASLDDKIEQNRRTSRALEGLARGMFKAWFVDFEPVKAKAAGQTSYPGMPAAAFAELPATFTDSELGPVPEGFTLRRVSDLEADKSLLIGDGYRAKRSELAEDGIPFIRAGNVDGIVDTRGAELLGSEATAKAGVKVSQVWDTVFTSKGTVGRLGLVTPFTGAVVYAPQVCFWRARDDERLNPFVLHHWMKSESFTAQWMAVKGQTDMADFVSLSDQRAMRMLVPPGAIQKGFSQVAGPLIQLQARLSK